MKTERKFSEMYVIHDYDGYPPYLATFPIDLSDEFLIIPGDRKELYFYVDISSEGEIQLSTKDLVIILMEGFYENLRN